MKYLKEEIERLETLGGFDELSGSGLGKLKEFRSIVKVLEKLEKVESMLRQCETIEEARKTFDTL